MRYPIITAVLAIAVLVTAGCGYNLRGTTTIPQELQTLILDSSDPYGPFTRTVRSQLRQNGVTITEDTTRQDIPSLRLSGENSSQDTVSIFQNGITAEYQMVMSANAQIMIPDRGIYPISAKVFRSFLDNPLTALAKDAEQDMIRQEMREQLAQQLVRRLIVVQTTEKPMTNDELKSASEPKSSGPVTR